MGRLVTQLLAPQGHVVLAVDTSERALGELAAGFIGVVVLDEHLSGTTGTGFLRLIRARGHENPVVFLTAHGTAALELLALQEGASDLVDKSQMALRLPGAVARAAESGARGPGGGLTYGMIAGSPAMRALLRQLGLALPSTVSVLIGGESGTGKELLARALHEHGPRAKGPFVAVNCSGIPVDLLESELFGYERGAFTGATQRKHGRIDQAQGGTLLVDEIGDMPLSLQAKLLRVAQESEYQRLGGTETLRADVRIVSATHRDLAVEAEAGRFRTDLYFRLARFVLHSPPLRERREDIPALVQHFVGLAARKEGRVVPAVAPRVMEALQAYDYPGNVRELENTIGYAVIVARGALITMADLPVTFLRALSAAAARPAALVAPEPAAPSPARPPAGSGAPSGDGSFPTLAEVEQQHVQRAMERTGGNKVEAARLLDISRMALYRKLALAGAR